MSGAAMRRTQGKGFHRNTNASLRDPARMRPLWSPPIRAPSLKDATPLSR